ncbi:MAG: hypothetical protein H7338_23285 [Candidatus Sericytochromatia bacterium]|nr:hypothetical protein [Candidatus Sericytochromatia bacterium]
MKDAVSNVVARVSGAGPLPELDLPTPTGAPHPQPEAAPVGRPGDRASAVTPHDGGFSPVGIDLMAQDNITLGPLPEISHKGLRSAASHLDRQLDDTLRKTDRPTATHLDDLAGLQRAYAGWQKATKGHENDPQVTAIGFRFQERLAQLVKRAAAQIGHDAAADLPKGVTAFQRLGQIQRDYQTLQTRARILGMTVAPAAVHAGATGLVDRAFSDLHASAGSIAGASRLSGDQVRNFTQQVATLRTALTGIGLSLTPAADQSLQEAVQAALDQRVDRLVAWGNGLQSGDVTAAELTDFHRAAQGYQFQAKSVGKPPSPAQAEALQATEHRLMAGRIVTVDGTLRTWAGSATPSIEGLRAVTTELVALRKAAGTDPALRARMTGLEENVRSVVTASLEATGITGDTFIQTSLQGLEIASALLQLAAEADIPLPPAVAARNLPDRINKASQAAVKNTISGAEALFSALQATMELGRSTDMPGARKQLVPIFGAIVKAYTDPNDPMHAIMVQALKDPEALALYNAALLVASGDSFGNTIQAMAPRDQGGLGTEGFNRLASILTSDQNLADIKAGQGVRVSDVMSGISSVLQKFETAGLSYDLMHENRKEAVFFVRWTMSVVGTSTATLADRRDAAIAVATERREELINRLASGDLAGFDDYLRETAALGIIQEKGAHQSWSDDIDTAESAVKVLETVKTGSDVIGMALGAGAILKLGATLVVRGGIMLAARSPAVIKLAQAAAVEGAEELAVIGSRRAVADLALNAAGTAAKGWAARSLPAFTRLAATSLARSGVSAASWLTGGAAEVALARSIVGDVAFGAMQFIQVNPEDGKVSVSVRDEKGRPRWGALCMALLPLALRGGQFALGKMKKLPSVPEAVPAPVRAVAEPAAPVGKGVAEPAAPVGKGVAEPAAPPDKAPVTKVKQEGRSPDRVQPKPPDPAKQPAAGESTPVVGGGAPAVPAPKPMFLEDFVDDFGHPPKVGDPVLQGGHPFRVKSVDGDMVHLEPAGSTGARPVNGPVVEPTPAPSKVSGPGETADMGALRKRVQSGELTPVAEQPGMYTTRAGAKIEITTTPAKLSGDQLTTMRSEAQKIRAKLDSGTLSLSEAAKQRAILAGIEFMEQSGIAVNDLTHASTSRALDGIDKAGGRIMSERVMSDNKITRLTGEGDAYSGKAGAKADIYMGAGDEGLGTVRAYAEKARTSPHYNLSLLSDAELAVEITRTKSLVNRKWNGKSFGPGGAPLVDEARVTNRLRQLQAEQAMRVSFPHAPAPYPIIFDVNATGMKVAQIHNLPGEATVEGMIDLHSSLKRVFVPAENVADATARLDKILGPGHGVKVIPLESLDVVIATNPVAVGASMHVTKGLEGTDSLVKAFYNVAEDTLAAK